MAAKGCDAKCYGEAVPRDNADPASERDCICGRMSHGAGVKNAVDNTCRLAETWVEAYVRDHHLASFQVVVPARPQGAFGSRPTQMELLLEAECNGPTI